ncbi:helix-hairpin-helix domain-containing protein [Niallia taxi]|uniref:helix-hairpin-helix domain-containing protein n=1 Tax=Niallia taxi TaxID=2499688 RepID=UPI002E1A118A|nr:helix-hairpin-helix domain-containing protein [Niallia taxi]MED4117802.1 helix-hairpin-helix domain-containing protein [Niallia taxi]
MKWLSEKRLIILLCTAFAVFIGYHFVSKANEAEAGIELGELTDAAGMEEAQAIQEPDIYVDVKGAVKAPGLYEAKQGERVIDIIERANGFTNEADENAINLAERVEDEMIVYIPKLGEESKSVNGGAGQNGDAALVNINEADSSQLLTLPGIGEAKASAIMEYREQNGGFKDAAELKEISGIGEKTFEKLKELITVK